MVVPLCKVIQPFFRSFHVLTIYYYVDQSEIAPKAMRGRLMSTQQFAITFGTAMSYWFDYAFVSLSGSTGWR